ncbi:MAG: glycosyltransferase family 61 protein, partial [Rhodoferax sp.]|nr:glycosyltransferase family 61 protein [Actinomycetota bacterium]
MNEVLLGWVLAHLRPGPETGMGPVTVAVLAREAVDLAPLVAVLPPGSSVRAHLLDGDLDRLHEDLAAAGRHDVVLDLGQGPRTAVRVPLVLPHVRRGGTLLVVLPRAAAARAAVDALLDDVRALRVSGDDTGGDLDPPARRRDPRGYPERDRHALAASIAAATVDGHRLAITAGVATWSVVREARFDALLDRAPHLGRVLHREPAATWSRTAPFASNRPEEAPVADVGAPALSLRVFEDVCVVRGNVAWTHDLVLPQAFRNPARRRPRTPLLADWLPGAVRDPGHPEPTPLAGTYLHADNILRGHFGHALTEQVSHLWAWERVVADHDDVRVLLDVSRAPLAEWESPLLEAAGVPRDRVQAMTGPVRVERLLATTPAYAIGRYAHPVLRPLHRRIGDALAAHSTLTDTPTRLFMTRRGTKRACHEQAGVEALVGRHGFTVIAPEEHALPDQVALVRGAEVVAGFGGSGLFHIALTDRPTPVIAIASDNYPLANERLFAALHDHPLSVVRG